MELLHWENKRKPGCAGAAGKCNPRLEKRVPRALGESKGLLIILTASSFIHVALE